MPSTAAVIAAIVVILIVFIIAAYYQAKVSPVSPTGSNPIVGKWIWKKGTAPAVISADLKIHSSAPPASWASFTPLTGLKYTYIDTNGDQYLATLAANYNTLNWVKNKDGSSGSWTRAA